jgi:hypothetical protein
VSDKPKGTPEQRQEYATIREQAAALVERMNAILGDAGRHDYRMELRAVKCALPMTIDDDDHGDGVSDPRYLPDVRPTDYRMNDDYDPRDERDDGRYHRGDRDDDGREV